MTKEHDEIVDEETLPADADKVTQAEMAEALIEAEEQEIEQKAKERKIDPKEVKAQETLDKLMQKFRGYRVVCVALGLVAFGLMIASMVLYRNGSIDEAMQNTLLFFGVIAVGIMMFFVMARVRPLKEDIRTWNDVLVDIQNSPSKKALSRKVLPPEPDSLNRKKYPMTAEYLHYRLYWRICITLAGACCVVPMILIRVMQDAMVPAVVLLCLAYVLIFVANHIDRKYMKPIREQEKARQAKARMAYKKKNRKANLA
ncbi:MAG: hypothetical protein Q4D06_08995 [Coriobacteriia bacterium]|nr:hypothetical protein [Coriobacteriia bacterium]